MESKPMARRAVADRHFQIALGWLLPGFSLEPEGLKLRRKVVFVLFVLAWVASELVGYWGLMWALLILILMTMLLRLYSAAMTTKDRFFRSLVAFFLPGALEKNWLFLILFLSVLIWLPDEQLFLIVLLGFHVGYGAIHRRIGRYAKPIGWAMAINIGLILAITVRRHYGWDMIQALGPSMEDTIPDRSFLILSKDVDEVERNRIYAFEDLFGEFDAFIIKRVVALPGDEVRVLGGKLYADGNLVGEIDSIMGSQGCIDNGAFIVPDGYVYVLGDNQEVSLDSRMLGFFPIEKIAGRYIEGAVISTRWEEE